MTEKDKTVTDIIGDEYQSWGPHDKVFISSPTGTGKTYFILNVLVPYVCQQRKKILYLVNRRILKEQLETELSELSIYPFDLRNQIKVELYQTIEMGISNIKYNSQNRVFQAFGYQPLRALIGYDYVVCDECHYFLADSNYNTNTGLSFRWIQDTFSSKVRIFLSATIHDIKKYIISDDEKRQYHRTNCYGFHGKNTIIRQIGHMHKREWNYEAECNYDYLDIHIINEKDEISDLVVKEKGKWLIFVDNISFGKNLQSELKAKWKQINKEDETDENVVMLSSDYESSQDSAQEVYYIKKDNKQSAKVLISTSVMDNGISIKDISLRNIVLIADTEVEFIQMLGRKRKDGERVDIYIYRQNQEHFSHRLWKIRKLRDIAENYWKDAKKYVEEPLLQQLEVSRGYINPEHIALLENLFIDGRHKQIMQRLARQEIDFKDVNSVFNVYNGMLYLNLLSYLNIENLHQYYYRILSQFDTEGDDAFLKEQLRWLGKSDTEIEEIIGESKISREGKSRQKVLGQFNDIEGKVMDKGEAIAFKKNIRDDLLVLIQGVEENSNEKDKVIDALKKNDRPISKDNMEFLKKFCNLPFEMVVEKASNSSEKTGKKDTIYVVRRIVG